MANTSLNAIQKLHRLKTIEDFRKVRNLIKMDKLKTYTVKQVTELLGMEKQTIMGFLRDGELPYMQFKQSGNIYIKATELTKFMDRFTVS